MAPLTPLAAKHGFLVMEARQHNADPIHYLLGRAGETMAPLAEIAAPVLEGQVGLGLAADEDDGLKRLLDEAAHHNATGTERRLGDTTWRLFTIEEGPLQTRLMAAMESLSFRPWALPSGEGVYAVAPLSQPTLRLLPIHRAITGLPHFKAERFLSLVHECAEVETLPETLLSVAGLQRARQRLTEREPGDHAALLVLPQGEGRVLRFRVGLALDHVPAAPRSTTLRSLDVVLLNALVLQTVLGIDGPERRGHPNVPWVNELESLVEGVENGRFQAGFGLNAPPVWELRAVMQAAQQLPPGTLRVEPELPPGLLFPLAS